MQAVILAAGRGKRMGALTDAIPKPMLRVGEKTLLEYKLDALPDEVDEAIVVVGYLGHKISAYFGDSYAGKKITYVSTGELLGTGHALWQVRDLLRGKFLVMMGDDIYSPADIRKCVSCDWSVLVQSVQKLDRGGRVVIDDQKRLKDIVEGDAHGGLPGLVYTGLCVLQPEIFKYPLVKLPGRDEFGLPQTFLQAANDVPLTVVEASSWINITAPEDLEMAERALGL